MTFLIHATLVLALPLAAQTISVDLLRQELPPKAKEVLGKANRASQAGDHTAAIHLLESAHEKFPQSDAWTESLLGVEYLKTMQFEAAASALECAVALLPLDAVDRANLGFALAKLGRTAEAAEQLRRAVELDTTNKKTRQLLSLVLQQ